MRRTSVDGELGDEVKGHFWSKLGGWDQMAQRGIRGRGGDASLRAEHLHPKAGVPPPHPFVTLLQLSPVLLLPDL